MPLKKGNTNIGAIYKGTTQIAKVYKGTKLLFENEKWLDYLFEHIYHSLIPTTIDNKTVQDKARLTKISGNGVIENQLVENGDFESSSGWNITNADNIAYSNNTLSLTNNSTSNAVGIQRNTSINVISGRKYLVIFKYNFDSNISGNLVVALNGFSVSASDFTCDSKWHTFSKVLSALSNGPYVFYIRPTSSTGNTIQLQDYQLTDLTLREGTGNEPTDINDNRVQALLNRGYIPYNTGSYKNSRVGEIECEPYNLFDGTIDKLSSYLLQSGNITNDPDCDITDFIEIVGGKTYTFEGVNPRHWSSPSVCYYDKDKNYLTGQKYNGNETTTFASPSNAHYVRFTVDKTSTKPCFHLTGTRTGYAPYQAPTKITLNGLLDLDGAINSHDTFEITNTDYVFTRNTILLDLGDATWETNSTQGYYTFDYTSIVKANTQNYLINTSKYHKGTGQWTDQNSMWVGSSSAIGIADQDFSSGTDFKNYLTTNNIKMVCELATPQVITIPKKHLGCVDLGSLDWNYQSTDKVFWVKLTGKALDNTNIYCERYVNGSWSVDKTISTDNYAGGTTNEINIHDTSYTSVSALKSALAGIYLFYETDAEVSDFDNIAQINAGGSITSNWFSWVRNQVINRDNATFTNNNVVSTFDFNTGIYSLSNAVNNTYFGITPSSGFAIKSNHTYLMKFHILTNPNSVSLRVCDLNDGSFRTPAITTGISSLIATRNGADGNHIIGFEGGTFTSGTDMTGITFTAEIIDLTLAFGAGNEPTSVNDPRIQYIINKGYIPYDTTGTEESVSPEVLPNVNLGVRCK